MQALPKVRGSLLWHLISWSQLVANYIYLPLSPPDSVIVKQYQFQFPALLTSSGFGVWLEVAHNLNDRTASTRRDVRPHIWRFGLHDGIWNLCSLGSFHFNRPGPSIPNGTSLFYGSFAWRAAGYSRFPRQRNPYLETSICHPPYWRSHSTSFSRYLSAFQCMVDSRLSGIRDTQCVVN